MKKEQKIKKSDLFPTLEFAPRWLADEFTVSETMMVEDVPLRNYIIVPACTKTEFEKSGIVKYDKRKKYNEVIVFVNPADVPEILKTGD
jgi:hypothetical protein